MSSVKKSQILNNVRLQMLTVIDLIDRFSIFKLQLFIVSQSQFKIFDLKSLVLYYVDVRIQYISRDFLQNKLLPEPVISWKFFLHNE